MLESLRESVRRQMYEDPIFEAVTETPDDIKDLFIGADAMLDDAESDPEIEKLVDRVPEAPDEEAESLSDEDIKNLTESILYTSESYDDYEDTDEKEDEEMTSKERFDLMFEADGLDDDDAEIVDAEDSDDVSEEAFDLMFDSDDIDLDDVEDEEADDIDVDDDVVEEDFDLDF